MRPLWSPTAGRHNPALHDIARLGRAIRHAWRLDPDFITVNHGSFGATPDRVLADQDAWRRRMEAQPTRLWPRCCRMRCAGRRTGLARSSAREATTSRFVDNATGGCNACCARWHLRPGDEVLVLDHGYGAVRNARPLRDRTRRRADDGGHDSVS